jgi:hypothetical protein
MTSENVSMNRDDVHARQLPVHRKVLNLNRFCHPDSGKIWTMAKYWTIQPRRFGEGEGTIGWLNRSKITCKATLKMFLEYAARGD